MVKPGSTENKYGAADQARLGHASQVVSDLASGRSVAPEAVSHAADTLVDSLWSGEASRTGVAVSSLPVILAALPGAEDQAALIGEIVAAGPRALPIWDQIGRLDRPPALAGVLTPNELGALREGMSRPPGERLRMVADMLRGEVSTDSSRERSNSSSETDRHSDPGREPRRVDPRVLGRGPRTPSTARRAGALRGYQRRRRLGKSGAGRGGGQAVAI